MVLPCSSKTTQKIFCIGNRHQMTSNQQYLLSKPMTTLTRGRASITLACLFCGSLLARLQMTGCGEMEDEFVKEELGEALEAFVRCVCGTHNKTD